ncbi:MAG: peptidoglycan editing factor PgeF [Eubacteriales bacterium]|nr:peptidoglycan editing factor PgeF [Eubacteriales bacterium]
MTKWKRKAGAEQLLIRNQDGVCYLAFPALEETGMVSHSFSTRIGGVSEGRFASMNFSFSRGDDPEHVRENYRRMAQVLGVEMDQMVVSYQTHTTNVRVVTEEDAGKGVLRERDYQDVDGLITNVPGMTLVTFYADCVPLYILDPVHRAIGLSHSGWRGTVNRMGKMTLEAMKREYGTEPSEVIVCIGPSICQDCFEVGGEVVEAFDHEFGEASRALSYEKPNGKYQLDLWRANRLVFEQAGVPSNQIHTTDICTHCNPELLFSHRTVGNERGNLAAFLSLKKKQ